MLLPGSFCCCEYGDNEGILTMFPAIVNVLFGVLASRWLLIKWLFLYFLYRKKIFLRV